MQKYVNYLLQDIQRISDNPPKKPYIEIPDDYEELRDVIEWEHSPRKPMKQWFGIEKEAFPSEDKLTDEQIHQVADALTRLWERFNFYPVLPQNLPERNRYTFLVKGLDEEVAYVSGGRVWIEFCDNDTEECPFPEGYCLCDEEEGWRQWFDEESLPVDTIASNAIIISWLQHELVRYRKHFEEHRHLLNDDFSQAEYALEEIKNARYNPKKVHHRSDTGIGQSAVDAAEIAFSPYVSLYELTGIPGEILPEGIFHNYYGCQLLLEIYRLLDSYTIDLMYPPGVPIEIFYMHLADQWDFLMVQHLEVSGFDLSLCSEDLDDCCFAEFCRCEELMKQFMEEEEQYNREHGMEDDDDIPFSDDNYDDDSLPF